MSAGSPKFTVSRIAALSLVSLWLAGCTNTNNPPAPVNSASGAASSSTNSGMLITPPSSGAQQVPPAQPIQPMQTQPIQTQPTRVQPMAQQPVQTVNGKIVYNRKYGDIPKGSYTGGSTYTVKRGDTPVLYRMGHRQRFPRSCGTQQRPGAVRAERGPVLQVGNSAGQPITGENPVSQASAQASGGATATTTSAQKNPPQWLRHNRLLRILNLQVNRVLLRCCRIINQLRPRQRSLRLRRHQPLAQPNRLQAVRLPVRRSHHGAGRLMARLSRTLAARKAAIKVSTLQAVKDRAIVATADGRVVYAGNALRGYGNLIIIKHNDDYLSAYAHNDTMLVREQQEVKAGQKNRYHG